MLDRLHLWSLSDGLTSLWCSLQKDLKASKPVKPPSSSEFNKSRALFWAREGRYSNALQALNSVGVAEYNDNDAYQDLFKRHPSSPSPTNTTLNPISSLTVNESMVLSCL